MLGLVTGIAVVLLVLLLFCLWALKQSRKFERNMELVRHINEGHPPTLEPRLGEREPITKRKEYHVC
jgi:hypothetical protein